MKLKLPYFLLLVLCAGFFLAATSCSKRYQANPTAPRNYSTSTPVWTPTPIPTATSTFSMTFTRTLTPLPTDTSTPTRSPTQTSTGTTLPTDTFTLTDTDTETHTPTPTDTISTGDTDTPTETSTGATPPPCASPSFFGDPGPGDTSLTVSGYVVASRYFLSEAATIFSLSARLTSASGNVAMALYADNTGNPAVLLVESAAQAAVDDLNTLSVGSTYLAEGYYWVALQVEGSTGIRAITSASNPLRWDYLAFGTFPDPYPGTTTSNFRLMVSADYCRDESFPSNTPTITPTPTNTAPCLAPSTFGNTGPYDNSVGDAGYLDASPAVLSEPATVFSLSVRLQSASGNVALAIYTDNAGAPSSLLLETLSQPAMDGLNTLPIAPFNLAAGTYWLAAQVEGSTGIVATNSGGGDYWASYPTFGAFPDPYPSGGSDNYLLAIYADYCRDESFPTNTPTETYTVTSTPTETMTPTETPTPALTWTMVAPAAGFSARDKHGSLVFDDGTGLKMWVIAGAEVDGTGPRLNDVWSSSDGSTWTAATTSAAFSGRENFGSAVFDDGSGPKMWVYGGMDESSNYLNDVWNSSDGVTWNQVTVTNPFTARTSFGYAVFDNGTGPKMWVVGGFDGMSDTNDVWSSPDGVTWTQETASAAFSAREYNRCVVFNGRLWSIAGYAGGSAADVWSTADGVNWDLETNNPGFAARFGHAAVVFNDGTGDRIWVLSGFSNTYGFLADVWSSADGVNWTVENNSANFGARAGHTALSYNGRLWVIAGYTAFGRSNDVWAGP